MTDPKRPELGSDEAIVERVTAGEAALFEVLVRRNNQRLFRAARAILSNDDEAEDAMQEAYVRAFASLSAFRGDARFSTWLTRICVNEALARRRKSKSHTTEPLEEAQDLAMHQTSPEQNATGVELAAWLERALDAVPEAYRVVFVLRAVEDMSVAETASCLAIPEDTVKTRLFRARALLRRELLEHVETKRSNVHTFLGDRCNRITAAVMRRVSS